jgi:tRNA (mo5U34)-methyltransferase
MKTRSLIQRGIARSRRIIMGALAPQPKTEVAGNSSSFEGGKLTFVIRSKKRSKEELVRDIESRKWFHTFQFDSGIGTPGRDPSETKLHALGLADIVKGQSVIDIGAFDGFFSFASEALGAASVVACDHFEWNVPGNDSKRNIELIKDILESKVGLLDCPVEKLSPETAGVFDVTLFLGVLYHAPDPIGYLRNIRSITRRVAVIETVVDMLDISRPAVAFYPAETLNGDSTNHFGPNFPALEGMLEKVGFSTVELKGVWDRNTLDQIFPNNRGGYAKPWVAKYLRERSTLSDRLRNGRAIVHAYV